MLKDPSVSSAVAAGITPLSQAPGAMLHWGSGSDVSRDALPSPCSTPTPMPPSAFQAKGPPAVPHRIRPYWTTGAIGLAPGVCPQAIAWEQEAAGMAFDLNPVLLTDTAHEVIPRATGELVWGHWQETAESCTPAVHPVLLIHAPDESRAVDHVTMVPSLPAYDPLRHHMALVLQAAIEAEGVGASCTPRHWPMRSWPTSSDAVPPCGHRYEWEAVGSRRTGCGARAPTSRPIWSRSYPWPRSLPWHR